MLQLILSKISSTEPAKVPAAEALHCFYGFWTPEVFQTSFKLSEGLSSSQQSCSEPKTILYGEQFVIRMAANTKVHHPYLVRQTLQIPHGSAS